MVPEALHRHLADAGAAVPLYHPVQPVGAAIRGVDPFRPD